MSKQLARSASRYTLNLINDRYSIKMYSYRLGDAAANVFRIE